MFFDGVQKDIQKRYPTIHLRFNGETKTCEVWEKHGGKVCNGWRKLWDYENHDGSKFPVFYDRIMEWLLKADTRNWYGEKRDLFRELVSGREQSKLKAKREFRNTLEASIGEDFNFIRGIKTFFMDPRSMPERMTRVKPGHEAMLRQFGAI